MKCKIPANELKKALKAVTSIYNYAKEDTSTASVGILSVEKDGLWIEYGSAGAYLRKRSDATILREGSVGIDLKLIQKCRLSGDVTLDFSGKGAKKLQLTTGARKNKYELMTEQQADKSLDAFRPDPIGKKRAPVELPPHVLRLAANSITYKPGEEGKKILIQADFTKLGKKQYQFSLASRDNYSFARYITTADSLQVRRSLKFILSSSLLQEVMKEAAGEDRIKIWDIKGGDEQTSIIRFVSGDLDFCHPVMGEEDFEDMDEYSADARTGKKSGYFLADQGDLKEAIDTVQVFGTSADPVMVEIQVSKKYGVKFCTKINNHVSKAVIDAEKVVARKPFIIPVHSNYLGEFIKVLPKTLPMRIEKWESVLRIEATNLEDGLIEYVVAQGDSDS